MAEIPDDIVNAAHRAIWGDDGRGMIDRERNYLKYRVQRAILAERRAQQTEMAKALEEAKSQIARLREAVEFAHSQGFEWPSDPLSKASP